MKKTFGPWLFIFLVLLMPSAVFGLVKWIEYRYTPLPVIGNADHRMGAFRLTNQQGQIRSREEWKGKMVVAHLFFTHCPVVCPKLIRSMKTVQQAFGNDPGLLLASFSVDPGRDSSGRLQQYARQMGISGNWQLLTGSKPEIYRLARKSLLLVATDGDGGPADFIHSELLVLLDGEGRIRGLYKGTEPKAVEALLRDINRLKREKEG